LSTQEYRQFRAGKVKEIERLELQANSFVEIFLKQISLLGIKSGMRVLDAGCGIGSFARQISPIVSPAQVLAVDIDSTFVEEAKKLSEEQGRTNIRFEVGNIEDLNFIKNEEVDVSYCRLVLPHLSDPVKAITELKRVTKTGGKIASSDEGGLFTYPSIDSFFALFGKVAQWRNSTQKRQITHQEPALELFQAAGLKDVRVFPMANFASSSENREKLKNFAVVSAQMLEIYKDEVISKGFMSRDEYDEGLHELQVWLERPDTFWMILCVFMIGTV
jgi:ubiquinone/menaquinone biosynthesis C-methylase UbiE